LASPAILLAFADALDTADVSTEHEYEYVVKSRSRPSTVTLGEDCVTHQSGMRTVAVWAAAVAARRGRRV
jgi:hypothetical protein